MTKNHGQKKKVRARMEKTGESYTTARAAVLDAAPPRSPAPVQVFICGGGCRAGGDHSWDGPEYEEECMSTTTCSKCGMHRIDYDMMTGP